MSEKNVKMILSSSILVPDEWTLRRCKFIAKTKYDWSYDPSGHFSRRGIAPCFDECTGIDALGPVVDIPYYRYSLSGLRINKNKFNKHIYITEYTFECSDLGFTVYMRDNREIKHFKTLAFIPMDQFPEKYAYIGLWKNAYDQKDPILRDINNVKYFWGTTFDSVLQQLMSYKKSPEDHAYIYKISLDHIGGPTRVFDQFVDDYDKKYVLSIQDEIESWPPEKQYEYLMRVISKEVYKVDINTGEIIYIVWYAERDCALKYHRDNPEFSDPKLRYYPIFNGWTGEFERG